MPRRKNPRKTDNHKNRPVITTLRFTEEESDLLHEAAEHDDASFQYWARTRLLAAAQVEKHDSTYSKFWNELVGKLENGDVEVTSSD